LEEVTVHPRIPSIEAPASYGVPSKDSEKTGLSWPITGLRSDASIKQATNPDAPGYGREIFMLQGKAMSNQID
jgi:hypothetical protein